MRNIFFLINTLRSGGAQQALASILENYKWRNDNLYVVVIDNKNKVDSKINNKKLKIIYLNSGKNKPVEVFFKFSNLVKKFKPEYIISTGNSETIIFSRLVSFINNCKHVSWIQFDYENSIPKSYFKKLVWYILFKKLTFLDTKIILISQYLKKRYVKNLRWKEKKIKIIPNTFSSKYLNSFKRKKVKSKIIICPGRLDYDKNHSNIIKALLKLKSKYNKFKCLFIGEKGNAYNEILSNIKRFKLEKNIKIDNLLKSDKFLKKLDSAYLVILLSKKEPFGVIALETIALKKNFIISKTSGFKDIIGNIRSRNIVKNYNNPDEIFKKIVSTYSKPLNKIEKHLFFDTISKNFESKIIINKWYKTLK